MDADEAVFLPRLPQVSGSGRGGLWNDRETEDIGKRLFDFLKIGGREPTHHTTDQRLLYGSEDAFDDGRFE